MEDHCWRVSKLLKNNIWGIDNMKEKYNLGMYGAGHVARNIAKSCECLSNRIIKYAVASRTFETALKFQKECEFKKAYATYDELLADEAIDIIYISTPTGCHYEDIKKCLFANKNVISEKPFTETFEQAKELFTIAEKKGLVLIDATWTMYLPIYKEIDNLIMGEKDSVKWLFASFGYPGLKNKRLMNPSGGGSLLDKGIYCIAMANRYLLGDLFEVKSHNKYKDGVDIDNKILLKFTDGTARLHSSILHRTTYCLVLKTKRKIIVSRRFWKGESFWIWRFPFVIKHTYLPHKINGYEYEIEEAIKALDTGKIFLDTYKPKDTLKNMQIIDYVRNEM